MADAYRALQHTVAFLGRMLYSRATCLCGCTSIAIKGAAV